MPIRVVRVAVKSIPRRRLVRSTAATHSPSSSISPPLPAFTTHRHPPQHRQKSPASRCGRYGPADPSQFPPDTTRFARAGLKQGGAVSLFVAPTRDRALRDTNARYLLFQPGPPPTPPRNTRSDTPGHAAGYAQRMITHLDFTTTPTADTNGTSLTLWFDDTTYLFGRQHEGFQRTATQRKISFNKVQNIFLTGRTDWGTVGGLLGTILTIADSLGRARDSALLEPSEKKRKALLATIPDKLNIHGGRNLTHMLATARQFIFRKGLPLRPHEVRNDPRPATAPWADTISADTAAPEPDWKDHNINVWHMPLELSSSSLPSPSSAQTNAKSPRKRNHDEFRDRSDGARDKSGPDEGVDDDLKLIRDTVTQMFESNWTADALFETTLGQVKLPAKIFVRGADGHLQPYNGPPPRSRDADKSTPVLIRRPWPGALVEKLPHTEPAQQSMCYIVKGHPRRGKFFPDKALALGVDKKQFKLLASGQEVLATDGSTVTPEMVLGPGEPGKGFAVIDLPTAAHIEPLVNRPEWRDEKLVQDITDIIWILGEGLVNNTKLQDFMRYLSSLVKTPIKHTVSSADSCPNMIAFESSAAQTYNLRGIDQDRFPLPAFNNKLSLMGKHVPQSDLFEIARTGKRITYAPTYGHQNDKIVPFPDVAALAKAKDRPVTRHQSKKALQEVSSRRFQNKVDADEADIPNRDAEIIPLGTGSSLPSKYRNVSATLVRVPGYGNYLFDAGENTLGQLRRAFGNELPSVLRNLKAIWISHMHADHHLGTVSVIKAWHEETSKTSPNARLLFASHFSMINWLHEYACIENFGLDRLLTHGFDKSLHDAGGVVTRGFDPAETKEFGLTKIQGAWVDHCFGALATSVTFPSGLKISYSGDCRPCDKFVEIGKGSTLLIHESTFEDSMTGDALAKKHSTMGEAIDIGRRMGARRILLTHFSQRYQNIPRMKRPGTGTFRSESGGESDREDGELGEYGHPDEVVLVAFDLMKVRLGEFRHAEAFLPTIQEMLQDPTSNV
ncbi:hypothetical protein F5Y18DRAFT_399939 [Xylariaceae sp. FL1019]|nr:hypothetical protein F5Y18DRAFT_399939 [Xylariaceae sp. FL1019]